MINQSRKAVANSHNAGLDVGLEVLLAHRDGHVPHALQRSPPKLLFAKKQHSNMKTTEIVGEPFGGDGDGGDLHVVYSTFGGWWLAYRC